jgi:hypothetical protein
MPMNNQNTGNRKLSEPNRRSIYGIGGIAALLMVVVAVSEAAITFLPGGNAPVETVIDWFTQLQNNWFMGLRNLGLLNIVMVALGIPMYFALYTTHRKTHKEFAALAMIISFVGGAIFFATNRAFPMFELSRHYAQATTDTQRAIFEAAGQAMLSVGRSHCPGTFMGFFLGDLAGTMMSVVMLQGKVFGKVTALAGIVGFALFSIFEVCASFISVLNGVAMVFAMGGVILNVMWMFLLGLRFLELVREEAE